jgi:hypothetical protein
MTETPQDFDFDAWLEGAERPERAVTVYQKAGLIADLDALEAKILAADDDEEAVYERGLTQADPARKLRAEYQKLAKQFHDSALTIRVQGHSDEEKREFLSDDPKGVVYKVLADAITSPKVTDEQVKRLEKKLGPAQFGLILTAYHQASTEIPVVSADFLPKSSTRDDGGE